MTARGVMDIVPNWTVYVLVTNLSKKFITVPEGTLVARGAGVPEQLEEVPRAEQNSPDQTACIDTINAVHYKPKLSREAQIESARNVSTTDEALMEEDWHENITLPD